MMKKTKKKVKKSTQKALDSKTIDFSAGVDVEALEKDMADVIARHGVMFPVGTNAFQEVKPEDIRQGFFLLFLKKEKQDKNGSHIKRMTFGSGLTLLELSDSFQRTIEELFQNSNRRVGQA